MAPQTKAAAGGVRPDWTLADRLRKARVHAELHQDELADELEISRRSVQLYENGTKVPKRPVLIAWALRCGVEYAWLINAEGDEGEPDDGSPGSSIYFHGTESSHTPAA